MPLLSALVLLLAALLPEQATAASVLSPVQGLKLRCAGAPPSAHVSPLWGCEGERAAVGTGRLLDWSHAGYGAGDLPIPNRAPTHNVRDFGAKGDNTTDDTQAFLKALEAAAGGVLLVPPGVYLLTQPLQLNSSHTVIRGAGSGQTTLYVPVSLTERLGNSWAAWGVPHLSEYCWQGGFIMAGWDAFTWVGRTETLRAFLVRNAQRGGRIVWTRQRGASRLVPGSWVAVMVSGNMSQSLLGDPTPSGDERQYVNFRRGPILFPTRVLQVDVRTGRVLLERALPYDLNLALGNASLHAYHPPLSGLGVEGLSIVFKKARYNGHHTEHGYNGVYMRRVANCWVRDVHVHNADNGILIKYSHFVTVTNVTITAEDRHHPSSPTIQGHLGLGAQGGGDNLFTYFHIGTHLHHDLVVDSETMTVFAQGSGVDLQLDHHRSCPYGTLWTDLDLGRGQRTFKACGPGDTGPHACAYTTFWNIRSHAPVSLQPWATPLKVWDYGPNVNLVGAATARWSRDAAAQAAARLGYHWEPCALQQAVHPPNLHAALVARRRATNTSSSSASAAAAAAAGGQPGVDCARHARTAYDTPRPLGPLAHHCW